MTSDEYREAHGMDDDGLQGSPYRPLDMASVTVGSVTTTKRDDRSDAAMYAASVPTTVSDERLAWAFTRDAMQSHPYSVLYEFASALAESRAEVEYVTEVARFFDRWAQFAIEHGGTLSVFIEAAKGLQLARDKYAALTPKESPRPCATCHFDASSCAGTHLTSRCRDYRAALTPKEADDA